MQNANDDNPFLMGNFAPVQNELMIENLNVIGKIPEDLCGVYMRNGPNPAFPPISYAYPFDGDGMIHAVTINKGKAAYRNRFVETKGLLAERRAGKALYGGIMHPVMPDPNLIGPEGDHGPFKNGAFIHIIRHANQYLAMWEGGPAYEMNLNLQTLGEWCPGTDKPINVGPHTRRDIKTGDLWLINYDLEPPYLTLYRVNKRGQLMQTTHIDKPYATMMHDFVLTENFVVFFDCPVVLDANGLMSGKDIIQWRPELGTRIGIMPKNSDKVEWYTTDPFFVFHFANAYESNNQVIIDYVQHERLKFPISAKIARLPILYRTKIDLVTKSIKHDPIDDRHVEFPRINDAFDTSPHRYIYTPTSTIKDGENRCFNALIKYDMQKQTHQLLDLGEFAEIGEVVYAPKAGSYAEDEGYIMGFVYNRSSQQSEFIIVDAASFSTPLARVQLPQRVPNGLHGSWMENTVKSTF